MPARGGTIRLMDVFGIRVGVDASWFLVLFLFIFVLSGSFKETLDSSDTVAYVTAVASALLFFASVVFHELGHALAARRTGRRTLRIDLWFFGGLAQVEGEARSPWEEFQVAVAGPVFSLVVVAGCTVAGAILAGGLDRLRDAALLTGTVHITPAVLLVSWLGSMNLIIFMFNLLPALPLDGGRIARAVVWRITGDRGRGTRAAAQLGRGFGLIIAGLGVFLLVQGYLTGAWLLVLGFFLSQAARATLAQSHVMDRLEGVTVADIMDSEPVSIPAELPLGRAQDEFFLRYRWPWFPVVDAAGMLVGRVAEEQVRDHPNELLTVGQVADPVSDQSIGTERSLQDLVGSEALRRLGALLAVDAEGRLRGVVTAGRVRRALDAALTR